MASAQKILTVDVGTSTLKFAEFAVGRGGALTLLRFVTAEMGLDPNKDEARGGFITPALQKILKEQKIKKGREVYVSISGQSVFMRFVKLPPVDAAQVEQVVRFEAQQNVPFPIDEVTWDYQMMPARSAGSSEAEAVIVAIKKEVLESEVMAVERAGLSIKQVDVAPFALLNAFRYSELQTEECALIIDMGARSTNLVFVERNSFWIRNVPIAGNQISQAICNEMQEPFVAAELLKKGKGFVSLGGVYADPDDADAARISKLIRTTMTKLHVDINRSIAYYRTTLNGAPPKRVFLTGGSSQLPYLDLFIGDKLSLPVVYFNPLRNVTLGPSVNTSFLQQNSCFTAELVGLALRATGSCPAEVTLDAPTLATRAAKKRKQPFYFLALFAWLLLFVCMGAWYWMQISLAQSTADNDKDQVDKLRPMAPKISKLALENDARNGLYKTIANLGNQRDAWAQILDTLNQKMPKGVWITEMIPSWVETKGEAPRPGSPQASASGGQQINMLKISGLYHTNSLTQVISPNDIRNFVVALADSPLFDIDKNNLTQTLTAIQTSDSSVFAQRFSMDLKLKTPIPLRPQVEAASTPAPGHHP
ncbi:MAG TPA: type IV pilus assembly protein PilM [Candidatus Methylacidiphilales bacterium]|jgi:type IV pilus assembly protein PilM|nr:type IV pilus assembly protein PilM [Candidatus Methylacidiphilales bacterium]